ncbi:patatin-like phospholipase family protein [Haloplanus rubicundus]|uniref:Patatin-like phospholipase family protein n=1 Tax=Haloplanus rubicundus TaxID=1547898 RepID=A0A345E0B8_9EURY|nr:patatin-like phospholipase family protein [Haloplanus rubicundus]AXG05640.1 patatin-like phospholipase family protein [Haloplanus rubicundus]
MSDDPTRVAVACQGGGSHTAFTAGVLRRLLAEPDADYDLTAFTGTSGGALCALVAWYGLRTADAATARRDLAEFWADIETRGPVDSLVNFGVVGLARLLDGGFPVAQISPAYNAGARMAKRRLRDAVEAQVDPAVLADLVAEADPSAPKLLVSAVDATDGTFEIFTDRPVEVDDGDVDRSTAWLDEHPKPLSVDAVLASASVPTVFEGVRMPDEPGGPVHEYWDGLFSQNPPIRNLLDGPDRAGAKPDEIWLVRINPRTQRGDFSTLAAIADRRNELAGSLSLAQELHFVDRVNDWIDDGVLPRERYKPVTVRELALDESRLDGERPLRTASKLDRRAGFIEDLLALGERQADDFLADRDAYHLLGPA